MLVTHTSQMSASQPAAEWPQARQEEEDFQPPNSPYCGAYTAQAGSPLSYSFSSRSLPCITSTVSVK